MQDVNIQFNKLFMDRPITGSNILHFFCSTSRRHHENFGQVWGRPGNGAPSSQNDHKRHVMDSEKGRGQVRSNWGHMPDWTLTFSKQRHILVSIDNVDRAANSPRFCRSLPENNPIFPCSDEQIGKSPRLWKLFPYYVECCSKHLPDCCTKSLWLQDANADSSARTGRLTIYRIPTQHMLLALN